MQAAAAAATASPRTTQRRRGSGTTFVRSAAACSRIDRSQPRRRRRRDRAERERRGRPVELGELRRGTPRTGSGAARRLSASSGVERVERVRGGQVVEVHEISVPGSPSSSRRRESPVNIRLLMVPSGWPSLSASSDWLNPP